MTEHVILTNRQARHEFFIGETVDAGMILVGTEVKAIREGRMNIAESYVGFVDGELFLINSNVGECKHAGRFFQHEARRPRKLLVTKKQRAEFQEAVSRNGATIVPLSVFIKDNRLKLRIGIATGKKLHDKRESIKNRDWDRQKARIMKGNYRD